MSEDEIIEKVKDIIENGINIYNHVEILNMRDTVQGLLDLYQKEKEKNKILEDGDMTQMYVNGYYDGEDKWKNKIRAKIKELEKIRECFTNNTGMTEISTSIDTLQELLEEE